jgi:hypothetical protein
MTTRTCPHCHILSHFTIGWTAEHYENENDPAESFTVFIEQCDSCGMPICGAYPPDAEEGDEIAWPTAVARTNYPDVPTEIAGAAREAHQALAALAPRASVVMARATLEATAKDKGITKGNLDSKIEQLTKAGLISEDMKEAAHEIRFAGNEAAHGDILAESISVGEATEIVDLMDAILERVYQEPAKVARVRASRLARQNGQAST